MKDIFLTLRSMGQEEKYSQTEMNILDHTTKESPTGKANITGPRTSATSSAVLSRDSVAEKANGLVLPETDTQETT